MKKCKLIFALMFLSCLVNAQDSGDKRTMIGIGIRSSVFQISELPIRIVPPNRLLVNVDPIKYARVEVHYGFYKNTREQLYSTFPSPYVIKKVTDKSNVYGGGVFGILPKDNFKFILGARYSMNIYELGDVDFDSSGNPYVVNNSGKIQSFSGVLGCEYHFSKRFSVGAEFSYINMKDTFTYADKTMPSLTSTTTVSESSLLFRFYPY